MSFMTLSVFALISNWARQNSAMFFLLVASTYLLVVHFLRNQRLRSTLARFPYRKRDEFSSMTLEHAFYIQQTLAELEFPFTFHKALQFALFRTYGIPSISELLVQTKQLSNPTTAPKRYVDTVCLIVEFCQNHPRSERAVSAMARMNYIHSIYRKTNRITNEDLLYTLSLFALEPIRWINKYEWRRLETFEELALGTFWKATGDAMEIDYSCLQGGKTKSWKNGLEWLADVECWANAYEVENMKAFPDNHQTAEETTRLLLWYAPSWAKSTGKKLVCTLMDERLRIAMIYDRPPEWYYHLTSATLNFRKLLLRHLALPRPRFMASNSSSRELNSSGRIYMNTMDVAPWYVRPTLWNRYLSPFSWVARAVGVPVPEHGKYASDGFKPAEVGPDGLKGKGFDYAQDSQERITQIRSRGCPFL